MTSISFPLPEGFTAVVTSGATVTPGTKIAHKLSPVEQSINIPEALNISIKDVKKVLKVSLGDTITQGDIIAEKKNFFGKRQAVIISSITGNVSRYERNTGNLIIRTDDKTASNELISPVDGKIDLCNNKEIVVVTNNAVAGLDTSSGTQAEGEVFILTESFQGNNVNNTLFYLDNRAIGKVVLGGQLSRELLIKGHGIGVAGFVGVTIQDLDINYLHEKNISLPVLTVDDVSMTTLRKREGKKVKVDAQNKVIIFIA